MKYRFVAPVSMVPQIRATVCGFRVSVLCAIVALLWYVVAKNCIASDAVFSNDGKRIYAIGNFDNPRTLREINLSDQTTRTIFLSQLSTQDRVRGIARSDSDKFFCITEKTLWPFDPGTSRLTKVCDAPKGGTFWHIAYDPKSHTLFVTASGEGRPLFMLKNGQLVSVYVRRYPHITSPVFTSDGEFFYAETGDLWSGQIESDEEGRFSLNADRYAPLAYLETANTSPDGTGVSDIAVARDSIYVQLFRDGRFRLGRTVASAATSTQDRNGFGYGGDRSKRIRQIQRDFAGP